MNLPPLRFNFELRQFNFWRWLFRQFAYEGGSVDSNASLKPTTERRSPVE